MHSEGAEGGNPTPIMVSAGFFALFALVLQNTALVLLMKLSYRSNAVEYSATTAVLSSEMLKLLICSLQVCCSKGQQQATQLVLSVNSEVKLVLPCILYVIQNNLLYIAIDNLDTTVYVVCSQGKILTSALFSYILLGKVLTKQQVLALVILVFGISCTQVTEGGVDAGAERGDQLLGLLAVAGASFTSGFSGVYLEKIYKDKSKTIWERNLLLSIFSLPFCIFSVITSSDSSTLCNVFHGFDSVVLLVVVFQAVGGFVIAFVMRYASTLLKCFAVSVSICLCMLISKFAQKQSILLNDVVGVIFVNFSIFIYSGAGSKIFGKK
jgi:UDP-sugar transporter A1/2/3